MPAAADDDRARAGVESDIAVARTNAIAEMENSLVLNADPRSSEAIIADIVTHARECVNEESSACTISTSIARCFVT